jgi:hypothetical protein
MKIKIADTDTEIDACCPVMRELRPHITEGEFLARIRHKWRINADAEEKP